MYGNLPDPEFIKKMYGLPQETHPERLFVLNEIKEPGAIIYDMGSSVRKTAQNVMGVDIEPVTDIKSDIQNLPMIKSDSADFVISRHSLEHVIDPVKALYEWRRILKPSGKILIVLPDHGAFDTLHPSLAQGAHLHAYTKESFKSLIDALPGFEFEKEPIAVVEGWSFGAVIGFMLKTLPVAIVNC